ncbi:hypothetical protein GCM10028777_21620 [Angustibacter speluncae]
MTPPPADPRPPLGPLLRERADLVALVALGGALGSLGRWAVGGALPASEGAPAWSTVLVNVTGAAALGALLAWLAARRPGSRRAQPLVGTGFLGGWTTFSAAVLDVQGHLAAGHLATLGLAVVVGLGLPVVAAWAAMHLTRTVLGDGDGHVGRTP